MNVDSHNNSQEIFSNPFIEVSIEQINEPGKYCIIGSVGEMLDNAFTLFSNVSSIKVIVPAVLSQIHIEEDMIVRVFGYYSTIGSENTFTAQIIQDFSSVDMNLYMQMKSFENLIISNS